MPKNHKTNQRKKKTIRIINHGNLDSKPTYHYAFDHNNENGEHLCYFNYEYILKNTWIYSKLRAHIKIYSNICHLLEQSFIIILVFRLKGTVTWKVCFLDMINNVVCSANNLKFYMYNKYLWEKWLNSKSFAQFMLIVGI